MCCCPDDCNDGVVFAVVDKDSVRYVVVGLVIVIVFVVRQTVVVDYVVL